MFAGRLHHVGWLIAFAALQLVIGTASAQGTPDKDTREINSYVLTDAALAKYAQATRNLGAAAKQVTGNCDDDAEGDSAGSIDAAVARINSIPAARAAIQSAGLTTREYIVFSWSVFQSAMAAWAVSQPGGKLPPGVSMANVRFYKAHEAAIQKLGVGDAEDACADAESEEESDQ